MLPGTRELAMNVVRAAVDVNPRMLVDPRAQFRYATTLASRLVRLQGGLILKAVMTPQAPPADPGPEVVRLRSIA
jgi:hypothetical protein